MQRTHTAVKCISYCRWQTPSTGKKSKVSNRVWVLAPLYSVINLYVGELCKMSLGEISGWAFFFFALTFLKMHLLSLLYPVSLISPENTVRHSWSCGPPQTVGTFSLGCCPGSTAWHEEEGSKNLETWTESRLSPGRFLIAKIKGMAQMVFKFPSRSKRFSVYEQCLRRQHIKQNHKVRLKQCQESYHR